MNAAGTIFNVIHLSGNAGITRTHPRYFGRGKATPADLRGAPKTYFFVRGSHFGQDASLFKDTGLKEYSAQIDGEKLYDLRKGKPDELAWRSTINREEADNNVEDAGYDGVVVDTADKRRVIVMFRPIKVVEISSRQTRK